MRNRWYFIVLKCSELRNAFDLFDRDKSGAISLSELKQVLIALNFNPTDSLLRKVMKQMDTDKNGSGKFEFCIRKKQTNFLCS
jgi:Ca2+-binding EF-hand superfamily protein